jgi:hypothetical protein
MADDVGGSPQRVSVQMGVSCGRLRLRVAQETADDWETEACSSADRRKCVAEVVQPNAFQRGMLTNRRPRLLEVGARLIWVVAGDDIRRDPKTIESG